LREANPELSIEIMTMAVGNRSGPALLKVMPDTSMAKLDRSPFQLWAAVVEEIEVAVCRIDDLVGAGLIPRPNVIKIDVEGAELEVLKGGEQTLEKARPLVFIEAHTPALEEACSCLLGRLGYEINTVETSIPKTNNGLTHLACIPK
jgi:FkbM family methyltransferase